VKEIYTPFVPKTAIGTFTSTIKVVKEIYTPFVPKTATGTFTSTNKVAEPSMSDP